MQWHLVFDDKTLDYIGSVLGQRPYAEVAPVLQNIGQQVAAQQSKGAPTGPQEPRQEALNGAQAIPASPAH
jgi:hypothetical protein